MSRKGICENGLWYVSKDYKKFLENHRIGEKVTIAYDPEDVSRIFLVDQMEYLAFELASYCEKYAGVSAAEYEMERRRKRQAVRNWSGKIRKDVSRHYRTFRKL